MASLMLHRNLLRNFSKLPTKVQKKIAEWIDIADSTEKDFLILGDLNIYSFQELLLALPPGFVSLNDECHRTNTNINDDPDQGVRPMITSSTNLPFHPPWSTRNMTCL